MMAEDGSFVGLEVHLCNDNYNLFVDHVIL